MTNSWENSKDEFDKLCGLWDKALSDGIFNDATQPKREPKDFFGNTHFDVSKNINNKDAEYWDDVISRSGEIMPDENMILMEAAKKEGKKKSNESKKDEKPLGDMSGNKPFDLHKARVKTSLETSGKGGTEAKKAKILANTPNFVSPNTVGPDTVDKENKTKITSGLAASETFTELEKLKLKLYDLEVKMNNSNGLDEKKAKSLQKQFINVRQKIEDISNSFGGSYKDREYYS
jgi:hypothetical protein